jgi:hypothetical protein
VLTTSGPPSNRYSQLEHRWVFSVLPGTAKQLHVEGFRTSSLDGDDFRFEYSSDGTNFTAITMASLPLSDTNTTVVGTLPSGLVGTVTIRVVDTVRTPGTQSLDAVSIDRMFIRSVQ